MQFDQLKPRDFMTMLAGAVVGPLPATAQEPKRLPLIALVLVAAAPAEITGPDPNLCACARPLCMSSAISAGSMSALLLSNYDPYKVTHDAHPNLFEAIRAIIPRPWTNSQGR